MTSRRSRHASAAGRWAKIALSVAVGLPLLAVVAWFAGKAWVEAYLRGPEFRRFVNARVGETLNAEVEFAPFQFTGLTVHTDGVRARGYEGAAFAEGQVEDVRAIFSLRRFFDRVWQIDEIQAQRLSVKLDGTRLAAPPFSSSQPGGARSGGSSGWLPNRLEVGSAVVNDLDVVWGDLPSTAGGLRHVAVHGEPAEGGWNIEMRGGELTNAGLPPLDVKSASLRQRGNILFINGADLAGRAGGMVNATGEVRFGESMDLRARLDGVDISPLLGTDWRARMDGRLAGEVRVQSALRGKKQPPVVSGTLQLADGKIEALPVLNQIALFTRTQQFRQLRLTRAEGEFRQERGELRISKLVAESEGLLRVEGVCTIASGQIDGTFQVGVSPNTLQWIPGSQERVFTVPREGYVWTTMRLTGPVDSPTEDLSSRLAAAAGGAVIDTATGTARDVIRTGQEAVKGALNLFFGPSK